MKPKAKKRRASDPLKVFRYSLKDLEEQLADLKNYEREEQEDLALMLDPAYLSKDGLYKGQTFAGARDVFISQHFQDLEGIHYDFQIIKERIKKMKSKDKQ